MLFHVINHLNMFMYVVNHLELFFDFMIILIIAVELKLWLD